MIVFFLVRIPVVCVVLKLTQRAKGGERRQAFANKQEGDHNASPLPQEWRTICHNSHHRSAVHHLEDYNRVKRLRLSISTISGMERIRRGEKGVWNAGTMLEFATPWHTRQSCLCLPLVCLESSSSLSSHLAIRYLICYVSLKPAFALKKLSMLSLNRGISCVRI